MTFREDRDSSPEDGFAVVQRQADKNITDALKDLELAIARATWDNVHASFKTRKEHISDGEMLANLLLNVNTATMQVAAKLLQDTVSVQGDYIRDMMAKEKGK